MKIKKYTRSLFTVSAFALFVLISALTGYQTGITSGKRLIYFISEMASLLPPAFVIIGLFEVWVKREHIEQHLGEDSGIKGYLWAIVLAATVVGGLYVALPLGYVLQKKGASLGVIFTYLNAAAICRIPMGLFELSFLGPKFTILRFLVSLPLLTLIAYLFSRYLTPRGYKISEGTG